jgi:hypothetical protein
MKKRIIRLAPNVPSWCDIKNNIYLTRPQKPFRSLPDDIDMTNINKGIKAGLIILEEQEIKEEAKSASTKTIEKIKAKKTRKAKPEAKVEVNVVQEEVKQEEVKEVEENKKEDDKEE